MPYSYDPTAEPRPVEGCTWVYLGNRQWTLIDNEDKDLAEFSWYFSGRYAVRVIKVKNKYHTSFLHRVIADTPAGFDTDHINGNGLDNRRSNLRVCTHQSNIHNQKLNVRNKTGFKGVYFETGRNQYSAHIKFKGKKIRLGRFDTPVEAAKAYDRMALHLFGPYAKTNFLYE